MIHALTLIALETKVCPIPIPGAEEHVATVIGYVMWVVGVLFAIGVIVAIGSIPAAMMFKMPHAAKAGVIALAAIVVCVIAYFVVPGIIRAMMGSGCVTI